MCFILASKTIRWQESSHSYFGGYIDKHVMNNISTSKQQLPTSCSHKFWRVDERSSARGFTCGTGNEAVSRANCVLNGKNDRQHQSLSMKRISPGILEFSGICCKTILPKLLLVWEYVCLSHLIWSSSLKWKNGRAFIRLLLQPSRFKLNFHVNNQLKMQGIACLQ